VWFARGFPRAPAADAPRYRAARDVVAGQCNDCTFLLNKKTGRYYRLDDVGGEVWALLRRSPGLNAQEITREMSVYYEVAPHTLAEDVNALIATLVGYAVIDADPTVSRPW
jgi:hypothetical protein